MVSSKLKIALAISLVGNLVGFAYSIGIAYTPFLDMAYLNIAVDTVIPRHCKWVSEQTGEPNNGVCQLERLIEGLTHSLTKGYIENEAARAGGFAIPS